MTNLDWLEVFADIAAIITALAATGYAIIQWRAKRERRMELESYLRDEKRTSGPYGKNGLRSIPHLIAHLGLTESQILEASFHSQHIQRRVRVTDVTDLAKELLFEYVEVVSPHPLARRM